MYQYYFSIPHNGLNYSYSLRNLDGYMRIDRDGVVILDITKHHNHRYDLQGFFYAKKIIVGPYSYRSKKELYGAIQKLLQELL